MPEQSREALNLANRAAAYFMRGFRPSADSFISLTPEKSELLSLQGQYSEAEGYLLESCGVLSKTPDEENERTQIIVLE